MKEEATRNPQIKLLSSNLQEVRSQRDLLVARRNKEDVLYSSQFNWNQIYLVAHLASRGRAFDLQYKTSWKEETNWWKLSVKADIGCSRVGPPN